MLDTFSLMPETEWNEYIYSKYFKYILMEITFWEANEKCALSL